MKKATRNKATQAEQGLGRDGGDHLRPPETTTEGPAGAGPLFAQAALQPVKAPTLADELAARRTQCSLILAALRRGEELTHVDMLERFGCARGAARIHDLREQGHPIGKCMVVVTRAGGGSVHVACYRLEAESETDETVGPAAAPSPAGVA